MGLGGREGKAAAPKQGLHGAAAERGRGVRRDCMMMRGGEGVHMRERERAERRRPLQSGGERRLSWCLAPREQLAYFKTELQTV